jgi:preprotein translocase subunit SecY
VSTLKQALVVLLGGVGLAAVVVVLARRRLITARYLAGWLALAGVFVLGAVFAGLVLPLARVFDMTGTAVFLAGATAVLLAISIQLSVSVSGLQAQTRELAETCALLEEKLAERERA